VRERASGSGEKDLLLLFHVGGCRTIPYSIEMFHGKCRHVMSSGAVDTTLPSLGYRDPKKSLALSMRVEEI
jgi:hypothetical protein